MFGFLTGLFSGGLSKYLMMGMGAIILIGGGMGYWYYNDSQETIALLNGDVATLEANQYVLEGAIQEQNDSILRLENQRQVDQLKINTLDSEYKTSRAKVNKLRKTLSEHDIGYLAQEKPGLIENIINRGTNALGADFERLSQPEELPNE